MDLKKAIILAGGEGKRLKPYTLTIPKPLMPVGSYPIIDLVIKYLLKYNYKNITIALNYKGDLIKSFLKNIKNKSIKIDYSFEKKALGTIGPLKLIKKLPKNILIINGDVLTDLNLEEFFKNHKKSKKLISISVTTRKSKLDYGIIKYNKEGILVDFHEKPVNKFNVSMGIYLLNKKIIKFIPNKKFGLDNLINKLINKKIPINIYKHKGYWLDIGRPKDFEKANNDFSLIKSKFFNV